MKRLATFLLICSVFIFTACEEPTPVPDYNELATEQLDISIDNAIAFAGRDLHRTGAITIATIAIISWHGAIPAKKITKKQ
ncbi:MAG: hypothetical protein WBA74_18690 [Cyclobacteriaceae bacterium]